jgi:hypothetical protein
LAWGGWRFEVVDMDGRRIDKVLIQRSRRHRMIIASCDGRPRSHFAEQFHTMEDGPAFLIQVKEMARRSVKTAKSQEDST